MKNNMLTLTISAPGAKPVAAVVGVVLHEERALLVRRANSPNAVCQMPYAKCQMPYARCQMPYAGHWGLAGGKIDMGESISEAAVCEIYEETGVRVAARQVFTALDAFGIRKGNQLHKHFILLAVLCNWLGRAPQARDDALEARRFAPGELAAENLALSLDVREVIALAQRQP